MATNLTTAPDLKESAKRVVSRRRMLGQTGVALGGAVVSAVAAGMASAQAQTSPTDNVPPNIPEWMKAPGDPMGSQPYGTPSPFEKDVIKNISKTLPQYISASGRTPLQDLDGIITPNGLFYERHHGGVPAIDPDQHRLMLHGLVDRPVIFTMEDLRRFPSQSRIHFLECSGNPVYTKPYGQDRIRPGWFAKLRGVDRRQPETCAGRSGICAPRPNGWWLKAPTPRR